MLAPALADPDPVVVFEHAQLYNTEGDLDAARTVDIRRALGDLPVSKDIVVTTSEDFAWRKDITGTIEYPAAHEGRVLYAKS